MTARKRHYTWADLPEITSLSRPTLYRMIHAGKFPAGRKFGRRRLWLMTDVDRWIDGDADVTDFLKRPDPGG